MLQVSQSVWYKRNSSDFGGFCGDNGRESTPPDPGILASTPLEIFFSVALSGCCVADLGFLAVAGKPSVQARWADAALFGDLAHRHFSLFAHRESGSLRSVTTVGRAADATALIAWDALKTLGSGKWPQFDRAGAHHPRKREAVASPQWRVRDTGVDDHVERRPPSHAKVRGGCVGRRRDRRDLNGWIGRVVSGDVAAKECLGAVGASDGSAHCWVLDVEHAELAADLADALDAVELIAEGFDESGETSELDEGVAEVVAVGIDDRNLDVVGRAGEEEEVGTQDAPATGDVGVSE